MSDELPPFTDDDGHLIQYKGASVSPDCAGCPCSISGRPRAPVPAYGSMGNLAVIGEGPSTEEVQQKHPFVGPSGKELNKIFKKYGIDRHAQWIGNALICPRPSGDPELGKAVMSCRPRLTAELQMVRPRAILALGKTAMQALMLDTQTMSDARGTVQTSPLMPGIPVITSIHPAALLRGGAGEAGSGGSQKQNVDAQMMFLEADIVKAYRISIGEMEAQWSDDIMVVIEPSTEPERITVEVPLVSNPRIDLNATVVPPVVGPAKPDEREYEPILQREPERPGDPAINIPAVPEEHTMAPGHPDAMYGVSLRQAAAEVPSKPVEPEPGNAVAPRCSVCEKPQFSTPGGLICENGHGGADSLKPPEGLVLAPAPVMPCLHPNRTERAVGVECNDCGMRAMKGPAGLGDWFKVDATWFDQIAATYDHDLVRLDDFDDCVIGVIERAGSNAGLCYDRAKVIAKMVAGGMTHTEAEDSFMQNQGSTFLGDGTPAYLIPRE